MTKFSAYPPCSNNILCAKNPIQLKFPVNTPSYSSIIISHETKKKKKKKDRIPTKKFLSTF